MRNGGGSGNERGARRAEGAGSGNAERGDARGSGPPDRIPPVLSVAAPILGLATLIVVLAFFGWLLAHQLLLGFFAVLLAVLFSSLAGALSRRSPLGYGPALAVVLVALLGVATAAGFLVGPRLADQFSRLGGQLDTAVRGLATTISGLPGGDALLEGLPELPDSLPDVEEAAGLEEGGGGGVESEGGGGGEGEEAEEAPAGADAAPAAPATRAPAGSSPVGGSVVATVGQVLRTIASTFADAFLVLILAIFLAIDPWQYRDALVSVAPPSRRDGVRAVLDGIGHTLRGWLLGQAVAMVVVGTLVGVGLALLGVPLALALGALAFLFEFIPTVGPWLAGVPAVLVALTVSPQTALLTAGLILAVELLEGNLVYPVIQKQAADLPLALTIFSIFAMGALFGFVGVLVAAPLAAALLTTVRIAWVERALGGGVGKGDG